jgi:hypothetical protein
MRHQERIVGPDAQLNIKRMKKMPLFKIKNIIFCDENKMQPDELQELREQFLGGCYDTEHFLDSSDDEYHDDADYDEVNSYDSEEGSLYSNLENAFADYYRAAEGINIYCLDFKVFWD